MMFTYLTTVFQSKVRPGRKQMVKVSIKQMLYYFFYLWSCNKKTHITIKSIHFKMDDFELSHRVYLHMSPPPSDNLNTVEFFKDSNNIDLKQM